MERRGFLRGSAAAGTLAAVAPRALAPSPAEAASVPMPAPGPDEMRIIESAKRLKKNVDLSFLAWGGHAKGQMQRLAAAFKKHTGIGLGRIVETKLMSLPQRALSEAHSRSGDIDLIHAYRDTVPTLATAGLAAPLDDHMKAVAFDYTSLGPFVDQSRLEGKTYGLVTDGDCLTYAVRRDMLEDPDNQKRFADKYGVPLRFPLTWDDYLRHGRFFGSDPVTFGGFGGLRARRWGYWWFLVNYYNHGLFPFNEDLSPNFDNDAAEDALEVYLAEKPYMPRDIVNWGAAQMRHYVGSGKTYQTIARAGLLRLWENAKKYPSTAGKLAYGALPAQVEPDGRRIVRSIAVGPLLAVVNKHAANADAAAHLAMFWASRRNSAYLVAGSPSPVNDPWRPEHFTDPDIRALYTPAGTDSIALNMQVNTPTIHVTGALAFNDALDKSVSDAWLGVMKPRRALKQIESDWAKIVRRIGKARLEPEVASYRDSMPKIDRPES